MLDHHGKSVGKSVACPSPVTTTGLSTVHCTSVQSPVNSNPIMVARLPNGARTPTMDNTSPTVNAMIPIDKRNFSNAKKDSCYNTPTKNKNSSTNMTNSPNPSPKKSSPFKKISASAVYDRPDERDRPVPFNEVRGVINNRNLHPNIYRVPSPNRMGRTPTFQTPSPAAATTRQTNKNPNKSKKAIKPHRNYNTTKANHRYMRYHINSIDATDFEAAIASNIPDKRTPTSFFSPLPTKAPYNRPFPASARFSRPSDSDNDDKNQDKTYFDNKTNNDDKNQDKTYFDNKTNNDDDDTKLPAQIKNNRPFDGHLLKKSANIQKSKDISTITMANDNKKTNNYGSSHNNQDTKAPDNPFNRKHWNPNKYRARRRRRQQRKTQAQAQAQQALDPFDLADLINKPTILPHQPGYAKYLTYSRLEGDINLECDGPTYRPFLRSDSRSFEDFVMRDMFRSDLRPYLAWNLRQLRYIIRALEKSLFVFDEQYQPTAKECAAAHQLMGYLGDSIPYGFITLGTTHLMRQAYQTARSYAKTFNFNLRRLLDKDATDTPSKNQPNPRDSSRENPPNVNHHGDFDHFHVSANAKTPPSTTTQKATKETPTPSENPRHDFEAKKRRVTDTPPRPPADQDSISDDSISIINDATDNDSVGELQLQVTPSGSYSYRTFTFCPPPCALQLLDDLPAAQQEIPTVQYAHCAIHDRSTAHDRTDNTFNSPDVSDTGRNVTTMTYYYPAGNNTTSDDVNAYSFIPIPHLPDDTDDISTDTDSAPTGETSNVATKSIPTDYDSTSTPNNSAEPVYTTRYNTAHYDSTATSPSLANNGTTSDSTKAYDSTTAYHSATEPTITTEHDNNCSNSSTPADATNKTNSDIDDDETSETSTLFSPDDDSFVSLPDSSTSHHSSPNAPAIKRPPSPVPFENGEPIINAILPIHNLTPRDLRLCSITSQTLANFCINYLRAPVLNQRNLRDLHTFHLSSVYNNLIDTIIPEEPSSNGLPTIAACLLYTLNAATRFVMSFLRQSPKSFSVGDNLPSTFHSLLHDSSSLIFTSSAYALTFALKTIYMTHHRNFAAPTIHEEDETPLYSDHIVNVIRDLHSTSTAIRMFDDPIHCFKKLPWFIDQTFTTNELLLQPEDISPNFPNDDPVHDVTHVESEFWHAQNYTRDLISSYDATPSESGIAFATATHLAKQAILHHGTIHHKVLAGNDLPFTPQQIAIGNLPFADFLFSKNTAAFPMTTQPTVVQYRQAQHLYPSAPPPELAFNFVMCHPFNIENLVELHDNLSTNYTDTKEMYSPLPTDSINDSIDFLKQEEYTQFRVAPIVHACDPNNLLQRHPSPQKGIIYQGSPLHCSTYTHASPIESALPQPGAHTFPITFDELGHPLIFNPITGEAYDSTTVQMLFRPQSAVPFSQFLIDNPGSVPHSPRDQRFKSPSFLYHVTEDPTTVPFSLAMRLIQVYTISSNESPVYRSWALPHAQDALENPISQHPAVNRFSYYHRRNDHPENRFLNNIRRADSPVNDDPTGEFADTDQLTFVELVSGNSSLSSQFSNLNLNESDCDSITPVIKYHQQVSTPFTGQHHAFLAVQTRRSSLRPTNPAPDDPPPTHATNPPAPLSSESTSPSSATTTSDNDDVTLVLPQPSIHDLHSSQTTASSNIPSEIDNNEEEQDPITQPTALQRFSQAVTQILTPKTSVPPTPIDQHQQSPAQTLPVTEAQPPPQSEDRHLSPTTSTAPAATATNKTPGKPAPLQPSGDTPRHPTFNYPPRVETFFDDDSDSDEEPKAIQQTSPDALTSSTRTDFTYPLVEDLTKTLLKYAQNANLKKLNYPTDLVARRRHFNTFMDNLRIICTISPWTRQVFDLWPQKISYSHSVVGTSLYNLLFTNITEQCQKHIIDGPPDFRTAIFTLRRHCAPLTPDHVERTREAFYSLKQQHQEVATSYLNRIRILTRDCYHAGIPNSDTDLIKRTVRGGNNHHFYAASYQRFDADIRRAELNDESLPTFAELESHLLNIDETRGLTIPSQQVRVYNQHAHSARHNLPAHIPPRQATHRFFTPRQQQAFSSIMRPYVNGNSNNNNRHRPPGQNNQNPNNFRTNRPSQNSNNGQRHQPSQQRPSNQPNRNNPRPPLRHNNSSNTSNNYRRPPSSSNNASTTSRSTTNNATNVVCNNCGRTGHFARNCTNPTRTPTSNRGQRSPTNNENTPPSTRNQQHRAYFITDSSHQDFHHQAFRASSLDSPHDDAPQTVIWPDVQLPQMEINQPLLDRDFPPSTQHQPPNTNTIEVYPDDPSSPHQRFGPPHLCNWLPDSGATSHYTPVFNDLRDVVTCSVPISLADGSTKTSTHKGTAECYFTSDNGQKAILGLTDVYFVEGLSHRLLSLTAISGTQNFSVLIQNKATTIQFPDDSTFTWPLLRDELPQHQAFAAIASIPTNLDENDPETEPFITDTSTVTMNTDQHDPPLKSLPLELISRRFAHRNFRNLMLGSLHQAWHDHTITPTIDPNNWPVRVSISHKRARNKTPMRQGDEPFHRVHLDLMRNPFRFGLTTNTNFSAYLFLVTTPGKLTGWIGLPTESTASITTALKSWLTQTELLGRTQSVRFIRTDAGTAFTSTKFISTCTDLGIKIEAAAPEHQEMNGICEAKWREVHNTANTLLNTARLGGAFFHHAHAYAVHIVNACPAKNVTDPNGIPITPYEFCYQRKPSLANFRVFGCPTFFKRYEPRFNNRLITHKQQLQRASRGIFLGFPDNSAGWLVYSPEQPQSLIITRDAYFDENFDSALCFDSKPFAGAVPIRSHMDPNGLRNLDDNTEPATRHQTGSAAHLGHQPSTFIDQTIQIASPQPHASIPSILPPAAADDDDDDDDEPPPLIARPQTYPDDNDDSPRQHDLQPGPIAPNPHQINMVHHQQCHTSLQKQMALYFQECNECTPSIDPIQAAMLTIDSSTTENPDDTTHDDPVDKYLPEPQSLKAVLKLDDDVRSAWLHAIRMEIKNLIDHDTFILGEQPRKDELIVPVKLVLKAKQTATGKLDKLKARLVARGDMEKRRMKKSKAALQKQLQEQKEEIANSDFHDAPPHIYPVVTPEPIEDTWSPCASSRGVKLLLSTTCSSRRTLKSGDFIGAYLQAKVIGRHFVKLPIEYAYYFPEYAKYFGNPLLLNKGIYGLVYSGKYWNIEFSEWLYSQNFIQSQSEPSYFVRYDKHNQWLRLLFFVDDMLYVGSNDSIEKQFEDSVSNRFDVKFLGPAQWFLQMRIHQHKDSTYTLDQYRYVLNSLQRYDPNAEYPERDTPLPIDYTFSKSNRPQTDHDQALLDKKYTRLPFRSAVCTLLYLAYNTRADILFAVCKLAKACICPGDIDYRALIWLFGYLRRRPYYAIKFYPDGTSNPINDLCRHHRIPYSDLIVFSDASWQDCPDTGRSTVGYMIFRNGALIEANSTLPTPVPMSTSEAEYLAACSATMSAAHIRMLLYDMMFLGTKQWRQSSQRLPTIPTVLMVDNAATIQIARNGRLTRKTRHIERRFHFVRQGQQDGIHQLHWIPAEYQVADILTKTQPSSKIDPQLLRIFCVLPDHMLSPTSGSEI